MDKKPEEMTDAELDQEWRRLGAIPFKDITARERSRFHEIDAEGYRRKYGVMPQN